MKVWLTLDQIDRLRWTNVPVEKGDNSQRVDGVWIWECYLPDVVYNALEAYTHKDGGYAGLSLPDYLYKLFGPQSTT